AGVDVETLDPLRRRHRMAVEVAERPELGPPPEGDLLQVWRGPVDVRDPDDPIDELPARAVGPRLVELARRVARGPRALRAVLAPGEQRAGFDARTILREPGEDARRQRVGRLDAVVDFSLVHVRESCRRRSSPAPRSARGTSAARGSRPTP